MDVESVFISGAKTLGKTMVQGLGIAATVGGGAYAYVETDKRLKSRFDAVFKQVLKDRYMHLQVTGKSGSGKTTLLKNLWRRDAEAGHNLAWIEIKEQDECHQVLGLIPENRLDKTYYFSPYENEIGFNVLHVRDFDDEDEFEFIVDTVLNAFQEAYSDSWGAQTEMCLEMGTRTMLHKACRERTQYTLNDVYELLSDPDLMESIAQELEDDPRVHSSIHHFLNPKIGYAKVPIQSQNSIRTKMRRFVTHPRVRRAICNKENHINFDEIVRDGILVCDFNKGGSLGLTYAKILASFTASNLQRATFRKRKKDCRPTFFYYDEFQDYVTPNFEEALSQFRSFQTGVILSHQYLTQLSQSVQAAINGCVSSFIHLRAGEDDYKIAARRLGIEDPTYVLNMPDLTACCRLTIKGKLGTVRPVRLKFTPKNYDQAKSVRKGMKQLGKGESTDEQKRPINLDVDSLPKESEREADGETTLQSPKVGGENDTVQSQEVGGQQSDNEQLLRNGSTGIEQILHDDEDGSEGSGELSERGTE